MGKWSMLKEKYPRIPVDSDWAEKVASVLQELRQLSDGELAEKYEALRKEKDRLKALLAPINLEVEAIERLFTEKFEEEGVTKMTFGSMTLYLIDKPYFKVNDERKFLDWIQKNGMQGAFPLKVNPATVQGKCSDLLAEGAPLPDGVEVSGFDTSLGCRGRDKGE